MPAPEPEPATPSPTQVIDLATTKPEDALRRFAAVDGLRVLVCGGGAACSKLASNSRGHTPLQKASHLPTAALCAREERPRRLDAKEGLRRRSGTCLGLPIPPPRGHRPVAILWPSRRRHLWLADDGHGERRVQLPARDDAARHGQRPRTHAALGPRPHGQHAARAVAAESGERQHRRPRPLVRIAARPGVRARGRGQGGEGGGGVGGGSEDSGSEGGGSEGGRGEVPGGEGQGCGSLAGEPTLQPQPQPGASGCTTARSRSRAYRPPSSRGHRHQPPPPRARPPARRLPPARRVSTTASSTTTWGWASRRTACTPSTRRARPRPQP